MQMRVRWLLGAVLVVVVRAQYDYNAYVRQHSKARHQPSMLYDNSPNSVIDELVQPIMNLIDQQARSPVMADASKNDAEPQPQDANPGHRSWFRQPRANTPTSLMDNLLRPFEPFMQPFKDSLEQVTRDQNLFHNLLEGKSQLLPPAANAQTRRDNPVALHVPTVQATQDSALSHLLEPLGMDSKPNAEVQVGRDRSLSILGMPVGRRDGLQLSPLKGLSLGGQNMYGPVAVNDKYNVNWDFLDGIGKIFGRA